MFHGLASPSLLWGQACHTRLEVLRGMDQSSLLVTDPFCRDPRGMGLSHSPLCLLGLALGLTHSAG